MAVQTGTSRRKPFSILPMAKHRSKCFEQMQPVLSLTTRVPKTNLLFGPIFLNSTWTSAHLSQLCAAGLRIVRRMITTVTVRSHTTITVLIGIPATIRTYAVLTCLMLPKTTLLARTDSLGIGTIMKDQFIVMVLRGLTTSRTRYRVIKRTICSTFRCTITCINADTCATFQEHLCADAKKRYVFSTVCITKYFAIGTSEVNFISRFRYVANVYVNVYADAYC